MTTFPGYPYYRPGSITGSNRRSVSRALGWRSGDLGSHGRPVAQDRESEEPCDPPCGLQAHLATVDGQFRV